LGFSPWFSFDEVQAFLTERLRRLLLLTEWWEEG